MRPFITFLFTAGILCCGLQGASAQDDKKPRLIVLTDISSLNLKEAEPDDGQSLIRLMLYTNELDIEGFIATSNMRHGQRTRPDLIREVVSAYAAVRPNLLLHDGNYPPADKLMLLVKSGQPIAKPGIAIETSIGEGKDTEGSEWIIQVVDRDDPRPVWVAIWGGSADLAQALWKVKATRGTHEVAKFVKKLRVHAVYDQDQTGPWLKSEFPELFYIFRHHGIRGMYRGGDTTLVNPQWVETNIRNHHGALGARYVNYNGGDIWGRQLGRVYGIKEGDTPSFLLLVSNGLNSPEHPEWGGWAGRFRKENPQKNIWVEAVDSVADFQADPDPRMAALYRWRSHWQADFAARMDWCIKPFEQANHAPRIKETGALRLTTAPGKQVRLTPPRAADPDHDHLEYKWYFYPEEGTFTGELPTLTTRKTSASFTPPEVHSPQAIHVILEVSDNGVPSLRTYRRYIITVEPKR